MGNEFWLDDRLARREDAEYIQTFLGNRIAERHAVGLPASYVLNINAPWGTGKTFFLKRFAQQLREANHLVAEVNAWSTDHADDPLLAVMAAIEDAAGPLLTRSKAAKLKATINNMKRNAGGIAMAAVKGALIQGAKKAIGGAVDEVSDIIGGSTTGGAETETTALAEAAMSGAVERAMTTLETLLDQTAAEQVSLFRKAQASIASFKSDLATLTKILSEREMSPTLYVLIDELDRCRPTYAISLLERAKHLFEVDNIVVVVATDTAQLANSIKAVYGSEFDSRRYLGRFFDRTYEFDEPELAEFIQELLIRQPINEEMISVPPEQSLHSTMVATFATFRTTPRDIQRCCDLVRTVATTWSSTARIEITAMLPVMVAYQTGTPIDWSGEPMRNFMENFEFGGPPLTWRHRVEMSFETKTAEVGVVELYNQWRDYRSTPLSEISGRQASAPANEWVISRLSDEFRLVHNNGYSLGKAVPISIVNQYPSIILKAGRFSA
ncbi:MAG: KAP family NTPase [Alphaproteobacteria bacterium]|nr:KAP family NTPase [Alphaproteobacteria bacterium]MBU1561429.1 KAP family NTPase [Alphaproteobacteria bacterium]MBU2302549.1 KAP family NTPase [Alphaproteobacteria bacterium]MBU2367537.1 KAP family NTPase [Alphaproteobacteria bacterium]